jgi:DNA-binding winged helix-turn-helix (wHTH) protein/tetratricopeptide (TPR) repeat protein
MTERTEFSFDGWTLKAASGELLRAGRTQRLPQQPLKLLLELLEHPGEVVTRERMVEVLWPKGIVDFDNSLNAVVRKLRVALGDESDAPRYIETLPRIGYRFIGQLEAVAVSAPAAPAEPVAPASTEAAVIAAVTHPTSSLPFRRTGLIALAALVAVGSGAWLWSRPEPPVAPAASVAAPEPRRTSNAKAYELYLQGMFNRSRRDVDNAPAIELFEAAIEEDPHFADAWSALSETHLGATIRQSVPTAAGIDNARNAALRAVELAPDSASAQTALANVYATFDRNYEKAEHHFELARAADPRYGRLWHHFGMLRAYQGRLDEALEYLARARELEPMTLLYASNHAAVLYYKRDFDGAITRARTLLASQPRLDQARFVLIRALVAKGDIDAALEQLPLRYSPIPMLSDEGLVYAHAKRRADALAQIERLERRAAEGFGGAYEIAVIHAALGDVPAACAALRRAPQDGSQWIKVLGIDPRMDALRAAPCFAEVERTLREASGK